MYANAARGGASAVTYCQACWAAAFTHLCHRPRHDDLAPTTRQLEEWGYDHSAPDHCRSGTVRLEPSRRRRRGRSRAYMSPTLIRCSSATVAGIRPPRTTRGIGALYLELRVLVGVRGGEVPANRRCTTPSKRPMSPHVACVECPQHGAHQIQLVTDSQDRTEQPQSLPDRAHSIRSTSARPSVSGSHTRAARRMTSPSQRQAAFIWRSSDSRAPTSTAIRVEGGRRGTLQSSAVKARKADEQSGTFHGLNGVGVTRDTRRVAAR